MTLIDHARRPSTEDLLEATSVSGNTSLTGSEQYIDIAEQLHDESVAQGWNPASIFCSQVFRTAQQAQEAAATSPDTAEGPQLPHWFDPNFGQQPAPESGMFGAPVPYVSAVALALTVQRAVHTHAVSLVKEFGPVQARGTAVWAATVTEGLIEHVETADYPSFAVPQTAIAALMHEMLSGDYSNRPEATAVLAHLLAISQFPSLPETA